MCRRPCAATIFQHPPMLCPASMVLMLLNCIQHLKLSSSHLLQDLPPSIFGRFGGKFFGPLIDAIIGGSTDPKADGVHRYFATECEAHQKDISLFSC